MSNSSIKKISQSPSITVHASHVIALLCILSFFPLFFSGCFHIETTIEKNGGFGVNHKHNPQGIGLCLIKEFNPPYSLGSEGAPNTTHHATRHPHNAHDAHLHARAPVPLHLEHNPPHPSYSHGSEETPNNTHHATRHPQCAHVAHDTHKSPHAHARAPHHNEVARERWGWRVVELEKEEPLRESRGSKDKEKIKKEEGNDIPSTQAHEARAQGNISPKITPTKIDDPCPRKDKSLEQQVITHTPGIGEETSHTCAETRSAARHVWHIATLLAANTSLRAPTHSPTHAFHANQHPTFHSTLCGGSKERGVRGGEEHHPINTPPPNTPNRNHHPTTTPPPLLPIPHLVLHSCQLLADQQEGRWEEWEGEGGGGGNSTLSIIPTLTITPPTQPLSSVPPPLVW